MLCERLCCTKVFPRICCDTDRYDPVSRSLLQGRRCADLLSSSLLAGQGECQHKHYMLDGSAERLLQKIGVRFTLASSKRATCPVSPGLSPLLAGGRIRALPRSSNRPTYLHHRPHTGCVGYWLCMRRDDILMRYTPFTLYPLSNLGATTLASKIYCLSGLHSTSIQQLLTAGLNALPAMSRVLQLTFILPIYVWKAVLLPAKHLSQALDFSRLVRSVTVVFDIPSIGSLDHPLRKVLRLCSAHSERQTCLPRY